MEAKIEYRVRPITRYVVTRWHESEGGHTGGTSQHGEFDNFEVGYQVAYALCKAEHDRLGWPPCDERIQYPKQLIRGPQQGENAYAADYGRTNTQT